MGTRHLERHKMKTTKVKTESELAIEKMGEKLREQKLFEFDDKILFLTPENGIFLMGDGGKFQEIPLAESIQYFNQAWHGGGFGGPVNDITKRWFKLVEEATEETDIRKIVFDDKDPSDIDQTIEAAIALIDSFLVIAEDGRLITNQKFITGLYFLANPITDKLREIQKGLFPKAA